jgi:hypothetical protein
MNNNTFAANNDDKQNRKTACQNVQKETPFKKNHTA